MASGQTDTLSAEHDQLVHGCGLLDRSERGKLALTGPDAVEFLNGQVTNELATLQPGDGRYAAFLTHKGKMLGDVRVLAVGESAGGGESAGESVRDSAGEFVGDGPGGSVRELLLDTERACLQALFDMIRRYKVGYRVELHKRTVERGLLSLIGPRAQAVAGVELPGEEHAHAAVQLDGVAARAIRTDVGVDLLCDAADTQRLAELLRARGASEVSEQAAECLRVERGRPRYGIDLDDTVIPQEASLNERAVSFTKGCYVGQETVARLFYKGKPNRHLRGLRLSAPARSGAELRLGERVVGRVGSSVLSPTLGPIALALVRREAEPGAVVEVGDGGTGEVVELPFESS
jgi:tRNA-modifying protein YgfZ